MAGAVQVKTIIGGLFEVSAIAYSWPEVIALSQRLMSAPPPQAFKPDPPPELPPHIERLALEDGEPDQLKAGEAYREAT